MKRPRGRPRQSARIPTRESMLATALKLLKSGGIEGFTMRALAKELGVTPMTIYHHFGDRDGLIKALADQVYSGVSVPDAGNGLCRTEALLRAYHACVLSHPELTLLISSDPKLFPQQARRITDDIIRFLIDEGLTPSNAALWVSILVDFTHGAAIATAMAGRGKTDCIQTDAGAAYAEGLTELLHALERRQLSDRVSRQ